ncbi:unnamed protein product [Ixodes hexagonus]
MQQVTLSLPQDHDVRKTPMNSCDNLSPVKAKSKSPPYTNPVISNELLETLRRECLERKVMARLSRRSVMIDSKRLPTKDDGNRGLAYEQVKLERPKCNYVLSENYENLSGDDSPAARSFDTSEVDHKAIAPFLSLLDAMEKHDSDQQKKLAEEAEDDLPEEGSLVIDDGETASKEPTTRWNRRSLTSGRKSPEEDSPLAVAGARQETPSPALQRASGESTGDVAESVREDVKVTAKELVKERKRLLLRDSKAKKISPVGVLLKCIL